MASVALRAGDRARWIALSDDALLAQCEFDRYRASGPGGQHRNKTESAVRVRHKPSGVAAISEESRSQGENRTRALGRLREKLAIELREPIVIDGFVPSSALARLVAGGTAPLGQQTKKKPEYFIVMAEFLDVFVATGGQVAATAQLLGATTGATSKLLCHDERFIAVINRERQARGLKPLRS